MSAVLTHSGSNDSVDNDDKIRSLPSSDKGEAFDTDVVAEQSQREKVSSIFTLIGSGFALISDGLQNNIMVSGE